jgi:hypothetical protein
MRSWHEAGPARIRSMLLCGADMAESMTVPGVWRPEHLHQILGEHGLVCIERRVGSLSLCAEPPTGIHVACNHAAHAHTIAEEPSPRNNFCNSVLSSTTAIRKKIPMQH